MNDTPQQPMTTPSDGTQRGRMAVVAALCAVSLGGCYLLTGKLIWAFVMMVVGVPMVALPGFLLVGMARQAMRQRRGAAPRRDEHTS